MTALWGVLAGIMRRTAIAGLIMLTTSLLLPRATARRSATTNRPRATHDVRRDRPARTAVSLYGRLFASVYDRAIASSEAAGLADHRRGLLARASGRVLELGAGTGLNLAHYPPGVQQLVLTEPEEPMLARLRERAASHDPAPAVVRAPAERLPVADGSVDTVVTTLALCTVDDLDASLREVHRVLAPGGRLLFLEHVRADDERLARRQDLLAPLWRRVGHGCHCNRATLGAIAAAGLEPQDVEHDRMPLAPRFLAPMVVGAAVKPR
jgi:ubiquinone/menaquinone biosynthesis C-methylase UbiE